MLTEQAVTFEQATLSDDARVALGKMLGQLESPLDNPDAALAGLRRAFSAALPLELLAQVLRFGRAVDAPGALHLSNLPVDPDLPPTPKDGHASRQKRTFVSEAVLLGLTELIGMPVGFDTEKDGSLVHDVVPVASGAASQTNQGSRVFLMFHNDIVYDESGSYEGASPDFIVLTCLRQDSTRTATTYYADARELVEALPAAAVSTLRESLFRLNAPGSYVQNFAAGAAVLSRPLALIRGPDDAPEISLAANGVHPETPAAATALKELAAACQQVSHATQLAPGDALLINNRKGVHARSSFVARHDGTDRWLQRTYVRREVWTIRQRRSRNHPWIH